MKIQSNKPFTSGFLKPPQKTSKAQNLLSVLKENIFELSRKQFVKNHCLMYRCEMMGKLIQFHFFIAGKGWKQDITHLCSYIRRKREKKQTLKKVWFSERHHHPGGSCRASSLFIHSGPCVSLINIICTLKHEYIQY